MCVFECQLHMLPQWPCRPVLGTQRARLVSRMHWLPAESNSQRKGRSHDRRGVML